MNPLLPEALNEQLKMSLNIMRNLNRMPALQ